MKKLFFPLLMAGMWMVFIGCSSDEPISTSTNVQGMNQQNVDSYKIPQDLAVTRALEFIASIEQSKTRTTNREVSEIKLIGDKSKTRSGENLDSLLYLINFSDDQGFVIMSADSRALPVYAISDTGNFVITEENQDVMNAVIEGAKSEITAEIIGGENGYLPAKPWPNFKGWNLETVNYRINPKLTEFQSTVNPYGEFAQYCTNSNGEPALSGCVAVATEQILSYYQHPTYIDGTYINWDIANYDGGAKVVAKVLSIIGNKNYLNLQYTDINKLATGGMDPVPSVITKLGYSHCGGWENFLDNESVAVSALNHGPILMRGWSTKYRMGHLWVIDGLVQYKVNLRENALFDTPPEYIYPNLFHCVWGFPDGTCNGYYYPDLYGFIGKPCFKNSKDNESNDAFEYVECDTDIRFLYNFNPIR